MTSIWVFAMDALAAGLIVMVLGSYYMWWRLRRERRSGLMIVFAGAVGLCGLSRRYTLIGCALEEWTGQNRGRFIQWRVL